MPVFAFTAGSFGDILSAAGLAAKIATTLYDSSDVSAECRASMSELQALQQTLLWIRTAVEFYDHTPIGNALRHIVHQEVAQCHLEMRHFDDHLEKYRRHLVYTKIASVCFRVWSAATSDLASLSNKLAACRSRLAMMLVMLNSVQFAELGSDIKELRVHIKDMQTYLQHGPRSLRHVQEDKLIVTDHLGQKIPIPILFCSTWECFHYILQGYCKDRIGNRYVDRGDYHILSAEGSLIPRREFASSVKAGVVVEMSIIIRMRRTQREGKNVCPRCRCANTNGIPNQGWFECRKCSGKFQVARSPATVNDTNRDSDAQDTHIYDVHHSDGSRGISHDTNSESSDDTQTQVIQFEAHYVEINSYLGSYLEHVSSDCRSPHRLKLVSLTEGQFHQLCTDSCEELQHRQFHVKERHVPDHRNLARLSTPEFNNVLGDVYFEIARRYPRIARKHDLGRGQDTQFFRRIHLMYSPDRSMLNNLATTLGTQRDDLNEEIALSREALTPQLPVHPHPDGSSSLSSLAGVLVTRFHREGDFADLDEAISLGREALLLPPELHSNRSFSLNNLADALFTRFEQTSQCADLDEVISLHCEALVLLPEPDPNRPLSLNNLAVALCTRFELTGQLVDLEEAISLHREALALQPEPHPDRPLSLNVLASSLSTRFKQTGQLVDLEEAIFLRREALVLLPVPDPDRPLFLNDLAVALFTRFEQTSQCADLDEAVSLDRDALVLLPVPHPDRSFLLNSLASALSTRFKQTGQLVDLEEAISLHHDVLVLQPEPHPDRSTSLNNLTRALSTRFELTGRRADLDEAGLLPHYTLVLQPQPHPNPSILL